MRGLIKNLMRKNINQDDKYLWRTYARSAFCEYEETVSKAVKDMRNIHINILLENLTRLDRY